jgi:hypothetical protein
MQGTIYFKADILTETSVTFVLINQVILQFLKNKNIGKNASVQHACL